MVWLDIDDPAEMLQGLISGYHGAQYVYTGVETGLFHALTEARRPEALADELELHGPYVRRFCEIGTRWGLVAPVGVSDDSAVTDVEAFQLAEGVRPYLDGTDPIRDMGDLFRLRVGLMGAEFEQYPAYFQSGGEASFEDQGATFSEALRQATHGLQEIFLGKIVSESLPKLDRALSEGDRVLDLGCGAGRLACSIADRFGHSEIVGVDIDVDALAIARDHASARGLGDRVRFQELDAARLDELSGSFDVALSFLSLHEIPAADRPAVFSGLDTVLSGTGVLGVFDIIYPETVEELHQPPFQNGLEEQWSELVWENDIPTVTDQRTLFETAGLTETARTTFGGRFTAVEAAREPGPGS